MDIMKKILNVFGILMATLLSLLLTAMLLTAPVISATASFLKADTLHQILGNLDYSELMGDVSDSMEDQGMDGEMIAAFMETELVGEMISLYMEDIFSALEGEFAEPRLTADAFRELVDRHIDELVPIMREFIESEIPIPDEQLGELTSQIFSGQAEEMVAMFPSMEELGLGQDDMVARAMKILHDGSLLMALVIIAAVLSVLIILCRFVRFKGFMWLGVVYLISATLLLITALGSRGAGLAMMAAAVPESETFAAPLMAVISTELLKGTGVLAGLALLFIAVFVIGRIAWKKRAEVQDVAAQETEVWNAAAQGMEAQDAAMQEAEVQETEAREVTPWN